MLVKKFCHTVTLCHKNLVTVFHHVKYTQVTIYKEDRVNSLSSSYFVTLVTHFLDSFLFSLFHRFFTSYGRDKRDKMEILLWIHLYSTKSCHKKSVTVCDNCDKIGEMA